RAMSRKRTRDQRGVKAAGKKSSMGRSIKSDLASNRPSSRSGQRRFRGLLLVALGAGLLAGIGFGLAAKIHQKNIAGDRGKYIPRPKGSLTYYRDVAPIVLRNCSGCHSPEEAAPFSLLTFDQVKKRVRQIAEVTARHYMPPWPPEPGYGDFVGE